MKPRVSRLLLPVMMLLFAAAFLRPLSSPTQADSQNQIYIVQFRDEPLASYRGGLNGLLPTSAEVNTTGEFNADSSASRAYLAYLDGQQDQFQQDLSAAADRPVTFLYQYQVAFNGVAVSLTSDEAAQISQWSQVAQVRPQSQMEALSHGGPGWIGADTVWTGDSTGGLPGTKGEGVVIGILDTGITPTHIAFADVGADGYNHTNPWGSNQYTGTCNPANASYDPTFLCNDKLIGAWNYADGPRDNNGHGTHVASIAAGNFYSVTIIATTINIPTTFSGVAPHANLVAYDVCNGGYCAESSILAALNQVILDDVDVINISLGMGAGDPWSSSVSRSLLSVREAGIFVAVAAGNTGPTASSINAPANAPWVVAVGNVNHGRTYASDVTNMTGGTNPPANLSGVSMSSGYGPAPIVYAGNYGDPNCATAFPAGTWHGEIVLCEGGNMSSATNKAKGTNVKAGGAQGVVIASTASLPNWRMPNIHVLPASHISYSDGQILKTWLNTAGVHTATITGSYFPTTPNNLGDVLYTTSSRGPNPVVSDILKPDLVAPGFLIQAAYHGSVSWANQAINQYTGTSQASPHVAGAAALLHALHPDWTPTQIQSAMMTTALSDSVRNDDWQTPANPHQEGAGRVDLTVAAQAGLLLDETGAKFAAANPTFMGDPTALNLPSLSNSNCAGTCQWTRTVSNALNETVSWEASVASSNGMTITVAPTSFTLLPGASQTFTVTANVNALPNGSWVFASLRLHNPSAQAPDAHLPIAVLPANSSNHIPGNVTINLRRDQGSMQVTDLQTDEITDLSIGVFGVAPANQTTVTLAQDPSRNDPYNNLNDGTTFFITTTLPALTEQFIAEIIASEATDMDLYVGVDTNMDGLPAAAELICASAKSGWQERCVLTNQAGVNVWVVAQNFQSAEAGDVTIALTTLTPENNNALTVTGPTTVPAYTPFALNMFWNLPGSATGDLWYALVDLGTDAANPGNIGRMAVRLMRHADDVSISENVTTLTLGDIVTYTLAIQPNLSTMDATYTLTDTIPFGLQVIPSSVTGGATVATHSTQTVVRWSGLLPAGSQSPVIITYQAIVDTKLCLGTAPSVVLSNELTHSLDNPGSVLLSDTAEILVQDLDQMCPAVIELDMTLSTDGSCGTETSLVVDEGTPITYCYTVTNVAPVPLNLHNLEDSTLGTLLNNWPHPLAPNSSTSFTVTVPAEQSAIHLATWTANNAAAAQASTTIQVNTIIHQLFMPILIGGN
ncbi:MAG: S8 family serine peptidase [Chloroflexi bacterium]|nr:S8 family serine peptidase [Chloroflexota bacterium]